MRLATLLVLLPSLAFGQGLSGSMPGSAGARTNYLLQSNTLSAANAAVAPWALSSIPTVTTLGAFPYGGGVWTQIQSTNPIHAFIQPGIVIPSSTRIVASIYMMKPSGTGTTQFSIYCGAGTPTSCTCSRSDGGACTAATLSTNFCGVKLTDLGTAPIRVSGSVTCSAPITTTQLALYPGEINVSNGTTIYGGAMLEVNAARPAKLCVTTSSARTCR